MSSKQTQARAAGLSMIAAISLFAAPAAAQWHQFGGPNQSFAVPDAKIAPSWPTEGPRELWRTKIGEGHSGIVVDGNRVYTMDRAGDKVERVLCIDAKTGKIVWKHEYESHPREGHGDEYGRGPRATPLLAFGKLYAIGVAHVVHALDPQNGKVIWTRDLAKEFDAPATFGGHACSPFAYKDAIITFGGGKGAGAVALDPKDGKLRWKNLDFHNAYSTPTVMNIHGQDQLIAFMDTEIVGADPNTGEFLWSYPCVNRWKENIALPMMAGPDTIVFSSVFAGTRAIRIEKQGEKFVPQDVWFTKKVQYYLGSIIQKGGHLYGCSGSTGPFFMASVNEKTGDINWRKRGFDRATVLQAGEHILVLEETGDLALTTATPKDLVVHSRAKILEQPTWTAPTLVGTTLFARDQKQIVALNLK